MKKQPKYLEIEQDIRDSIISNCLKSGDQIMTEDELCKKYNVSRMTVNKAISKLVSSGYIHRVPGKGSFVRNPHKTKTLSMATSFSNDMESIGLKPGSKLIEYRVFRGNEIPSIAEKLKVSKNDMIHYFVRLRTGNDLPMALSYTYVSSLCVPTIDISSLDGSFYKYLDSIGLKRSYIEGEITATLPTQEQKELLGISDEALLVNSHMTYLEGDEPMEYIKTYYVGSRYSYSFVFPIDNE